MNENWYDYVNPRYSEKAKLCYMDTKNIVYLKTNYVYKDIAQDIETRFDNSNYESDRLLRKAKHKKVIRLMKNDLGGKVLTKIVGLRAKTYSYLIDDGCEDKKVKVPKKCVMKRNLKFENYENCLEATWLENKINHLENDKICIDSLGKNFKEFMKNNKSILKTQQRFKSERHNVFTEEINKIALSSNNDKRMQAIDLIETYVYGTGKVLVIE